MIIPTIERLTIDAMASINTSLFSDFGLDIKNRKISETEVTYKMNQAVTTCTIC